MCDIRKRIFEQEFLHCIIATGRAVKCISFVGVGEKCGSKIERGSETIGSMGNCIKAINPMIQTQQAKISVDCTAIRDSGLPIIFVIGGPGVGKRTLCNQVAEKYGLDGIITTDVLREDVAKRSERSFMLARLMSQGQLVPANVLLDLIAVRMLNQLTEKKGFILSGFPREKQQCVLFDREVRPPDLVLFLDVRNSVLSDRIMARSVQATERLSVNFEYIKSRIKEFRRRNKPIIKYYKKSSLLKTIDAEHEAIEVLESACNIIGEVLSNLSESQVYNV
ncbi:unnamed protein product [Xylocopa violacea]|uniref:Adenylate kinase n=1 Tax=Xylocopa violacea TaxID=135666 RepID=A0ABP1NZZ9_XYLVO